MKGFINYDDYLAGLPKERQERIQAKTNELLAKIEKEKQQTITLTLNGAVMAWLNKRSSHSPQAQIDELLNNMMLQEMA